METFKEILEAKVTRNLTDTYPAAKGEQKFVDKHIQMDILKNFRQKGNDELFNGKIVKTFPRKKNRFGNDETASIVKYESEEVAEATINPPVVGKRKKIKNSQRHVYVDGKYAGTATWSKTNNDALKSWVKEHPGSHSTKIKVAHESEEITEISKDKLNNYVTRAKEARDSDLEDLNKMAGKYVGGKLPQFNKIKDSFEKNIKKSQLGINKAEKFLNKKSVEEDVVLEDAAKGTIKSFANSDGKMKQSDSIDKADGKDKVKEYIFNLRKKKK